MTCELHGIVNYSHLSLLAGGMKANVASMSCSFGSLTAGAGRSPHMVQIAKLLPHLMAALRRIHVRAQIGEHVSSRVRALHAVSDCVDCSRIVPQRKIRRATARGMSFGQDRPQFKTSFVRITKSAPWMWRLRHRRAND